MPGSRQQLTMAFDSVDTAVPTENASRSHELKELRETLEKLKLERDISILRLHNAQVQEAQAFESQLAQVVDRSHLRSRGQFSDLAGHSLFLNTNGRKDGKNEPFIRSEDDLRDMRDVSRVLVETNEFAKGIVERLSDYVVGGGYMYDVVPKRGNGLSKTDNENLTRMVLDVLHEFMDENRWVGEKEGEIFRRVRRDGEALPRLHHIGGGRVKLRIVEPDFIKQPRGNVDQLEQWLSQQYPRLTNWRQDQSWTFGVHTPEGDVEDVLGHFIEWNPGGKDWEYAPHWEVEHLKANVDGNIKRGISDFFPNHDLLTMGAKLLRSTTTSATVQAKIAYITEFEEGVSESGASTMFSGKATHSRTDHLQNGNIRNRDTRVFEDGTVLGIPSGRKYHPGPMGTPQGPTYIEVADASIRSAGARWSMPEFMVTGDAGNGSFAGQSVAGSAFDRCIRSSQGSLRRAFIRILWKVVRFAWAYNRFRDFDIRSVRDLMNLVEIKAEPPDVQTVDRDKEAVRRKLLHDSGILGSRSWASQEGLDFEKERQDILEDHDNRIVTPTGRFGQTNSIIPDNKAEGGQDFMAARQAGEGLAENIAAAAAKTDRSPSEARIRAGNFRKGKVTVQGLPIAIETPRGATRSGTDSKGRAWSVVMQSHYGFIRRTNGSDGDQVDVFLGPNPESEIVYVIDQVNQGDGSFDEHKVMVGWLTQKAAVTAYLENYTAGWKVGPVTPMTMGQFKDWLADGDNTAPVSKEGF